MNLESVRGGALRRRGVLVACILLVAPLWTGAAAFGQQPPPQVINVGVDLRFSGLAAADGAALIAQAQALYTAAGFAPNAGQQRVNIFDRNAMGAPADQFIVAISNNAPAGQPLGVAFPRDQTATVNLNIINAEIGAGANQARRNMAYGEVAAHEVGHLLSAVHQCLGPGAKREIVRNQMTGMDERVVTQCMGDPTLMSDGRCVGAANIGTSRLAFNAASIRQIGTGITDLVNARNRNMQAPQRFGSLELIEGNTNAEPVMFGGETHTPWDDGVSFNYALTGRTDLFSLGWLNDAGQFIRAMSDLDNPDRTLESVGGAFLQFALVGNMGTPFDGQVFPQSDFAMSTLGGLVNSPGEARTPGVAEPYYSQATVNFDVQGNLVELALNTGMFGDHNGFIVSNVPEPATFGLAVGAGVAMLCIRRRKI